MNQTVKNILTSLAFVLVTLGLVIGAFYLTKPVVEKNAMKEKIETYSVILSDIDSLEDALKETDPETIKEKLVAKNDKGVILGTVYNAVKENQYGVIEILVAVAADGKILGIEAMVDQSIGADLTKAYVESFKGSNIATPGSIDGISRPSAVFSLDTVDQILKDVSTSQGVVEVEPTVYEKLFGEDYVLASKVEINNGVIKHSYTVSGSNGNGVVYYLEGLGDYNGPDSEKLLGTRIILDENDVIIGYDFDDAEVKYEHTKGFQRHVKAFLDGFINDGLDIKLLADGIDTTTGASFSKALMYAMLLELSSFLGE